jgi:hypothetical protein
LNGYIWPPEISGVLCPGVDMKSKLILAFAAAALLVALPTPPASAQSSNACTSHCQKIHGSGGKTYSNCLKVCESRARNKKI